MNPLKNNVYTFLGDLLYWFTQCQKHYFDVSRIRTWIVENMLPLDYLDVLSGSVV